MTEKEYFILVQIEQDLLDMVLGLRSADDEILQGLVTESNEIKHTVDRKLRQLPLLKIHLKMFNRLMELYSYKYELEFDKLIEEK